MRDPQQIKWKTRITDLLGIKYPVIEGALAYIGRAELAAAVSDAGGLGMVTAWTLRTPEKLRVEIKKVRALTDKPFAVNLSPTVDPILGPMREVAIQEQVPVIETAGYPGYRRLETGSVRKARLKALVWL